MAAHSARKLFYGWWVVIAAAVGLSLGYSNIVWVAFGLFIMPLTAEFGWGRGDISLIFTIMSLIVVVVAPVAGMLADRFGSRRVLLPSIACFGLCVGAIATMTESLPRLYAQHALLAIFAAGTIPAIYTQAVVSWFDKYRGIALGVALSGIGIGAIFVPPLVNWLIAQSGWRAAYLGIAALILTVGFPTVFLLLRNSPSELGLAPDGATDVPMRSLPFDQSGLTLRAALRSRSFWLLLVGFALLGIPTSAMTVHLTPLLIDQGAPAWQAALGASTLGGALIVGRLLGGALLDRYPAPNVVIGFLLCPLLALLLLAGGAPRQLGFVCALLLGLGFGAEFDFMSYLVSRYLGLRAFGLLCGAMYASFALGAAVGPPLMGYTQQTTGSYTRALWILAASIVLAMLPFASLGRVPVNPRRKPRQGPIAAAADRSD